MIKMKVSAQEAKVLLSRIGHETCQQGVMAHWRTYTDKNGKEQATAQSICWLYYWAVTGQNSERAARQARRAFDDIFSHSYGWLHHQPHQRLSLEAARNFRYMEGNIEQELRSCLQRNSS